jgi:hypothetical protein
MKKLLLTVYALLLVLVTQGQDDVPNNTKDEAVVISAPMIFTGSLSPAGDVDYYKLVIETSAVYEFDVFVSGTNLDVVFYLTDYSESKIYYSESNTGGNDVNKDVLLCAGEYLIKVYEDNGETFADTYEFNLNVVTNDQCECNNTQSDAFPIGTDTTLNFMLYGYNSYYGEINYDVDYFLLNITEGGVLTTEVVNNTPDSEIDFTIFDLDSNEVHGYHPTSGGGGDITEFTLLCPGEYYLRIKDGGDGSEMSTELNVLNLTFNSSDIYECNNSQPTASEIALDSTISFSIHGYNYLIEEPGASSDDVDYFKTWFDNTGVLKLFFQNNTDESPFFVQVLNEDGAEIWSTTSSGDITYYAQVCAGMYFIRIQEDNNFGGLENSPALNNLTISFINDEFECNNEFESAYPIGVNDTLSFTILGKNKLYEIDNDRDYFKFTPDCDGILSLGLYNATIGVQVYARVIEDFFAFPVEKTLYAGTYGILDQDTVHLLGGQQYFIEVYDSGDNNQSEGLIQLGLNYTTFVTDSILIDGSLSFCSGEGEVLLTAEQPDATYLWNTGATTQAITVTSGGWYAVTVEVDACSLYSDSIFVEELVAPVVTLSDTYIEVCTYELPIIVVADGAATYEWSTGEAGEDIVITSAGVYYVTGTGLNGCSSVSEDLLVEVNEPPMVYITPLFTDTIICDADVLTLSALEGPGYTFNWSTGSTDNTIAVEESGIYTVTITDANGCISESDELNVSVAPTPETPTINLVGTQLQCSVIGSAYQWYFDLTPIPSATEQNYTPTENGTYRVEVFNLFNCSAISEPFSFTLDGINSNEKPFNVFIWPNPATNSIFISFDENTFEGSSIYLYNVEGKRIFENKLNNSKLFEIDITDFPSGLYQLVVQNEEYVVMENVLIVE